jgi:sulfhydrogenase subunit beta (sulfur reductase)
MWRPQNAEIAIVNNDQSSAVSEPAASKNRRDVPKPVVMKPEGLVQLLENLKKRGYRTIGPRVQDSAIVLDDIEKMEDLPIGWQEKQDGGKYHLTKTKSKVVFGFTHGPQSWKRWLHAPNVCLWKAKQNGSDFQVQQTIEPPEKLAFLGVRACELKAISIQDKVFLASSFRDSFYKSHRDGNLIIALNCSRAGGTCFCVSTDSGPAVKSDYDLLLTEVHSGSTHHFIVEFGSKAGAMVMEGVASTPAESKQTEEASAVVAAAAKQMGRVLDTKDIKQLLYRNLENSRWAEVASRCLSCGNCTLVCPTCFCTTVEDVTDLTGTEAERWRRWDSCFTMDFSYIHGGSVRTSHGMRYRQWLTHKLASWQEQFGTLGCVGCGRCITWCPVGIDITEEARAIRESDSIEPSANKGKE